MLFLLRWLSRRSLRFLHALGALLGWLAYALSPSYRRRLRGNAGAGRHVAGRSARQSVAEAGSMVMELPAPVAAPGRPADRRPGAVAGRAS